MSVTKTGWCECSSTRVHHRNREGGEFLFDLDADTGRKLWARCFGELVQESAHMRWLTQRSPAVDGDRLRFLSMQGEHFCLRVADGEIVWRVHYSQVFGTGRPPFGFSDHPLVIGNRVICAPSATNAAVAALDRETVALIWKMMVERPLRYGYAPMVRSKAAGVPHSKVIWPSGPFTISAKAESSRTSSCHFSPTAFT